MSQPLATLIQRRRIVVCCGAGGVGKTTTATGLALAAARLGKRVLALTVDPSKRLAETLGVDRNAPKPVSVGGALLEQAGIRAPGSLAAWMLDPRWVADQVVLRLSRSPDERHRLSQNRIYLGLSNMVAGMHEYMAMEALYHYATSGEYDLVVLDTPPSRDALAFLESPGRMRSFLDGHVLSLFVPSDQDSLLRRAARRVVHRVNALVFGPETLADIQAFFGSFAHVLANLNRNASTMLERLSDPEQVAFVLVTSPQSAAVNELRYFRRRTLEMGLVCAGTILNRSYALPKHRVFPKPSWVQGPDPQLAATAYAKFAELARFEQAQVRRDQQLLAQLTAEGGGQSWAIATPAIASGAGDLQALLQLSDALMQPPG